MSVILLYWCFVKSCEFLSPKVANVPFMSENKRNVFVHDGMCDKSIDLERSPKRHNSIFTILKQTMTEDDLEFMMNMYGHLRALNRDEICDVMFIGGVRGPAPNSPQHNNVMVVWNVFATYLPPSCNLLNYV